MMYVSANQKAVSLYLHRHTGSGSTLVGRMVEDTSW
jgi:hypothetical protein